MVLLQFMLGCWLLVVLWAVRTEAWVIVHVLGIVLVLAAEHVMAANFELRKVASITW